LPGYAIRRIPQAITVPGRAECEVVVDCDDGGGRIGASGVVVGVGTTRPDVFRYFVVELVVVIYYVVGGTAAVGS